MNTIYIASEALPDRRQSHALTRVLVERIAKAAKSGVYPVYWLDSGKPVFTAGGRFLSVTHTGGKLYVAVSCVPLGIDAEVRREIPERVKKEWLSPSEQKRDFFAVWTAKEAVAKMDGRGLSVVKKILVEDHVAKLGPVFYCLKRMERGDTVITVAAWDLGEIVWVE